MPEFAFDVVDPKGRRTKATVEAPTKADARRSLASNGFQVIGSATPDVPGSTEASSIEDVGVPPTAVVVVGVDLPFVDVFVACLKVFASHVIIGVVLAVLYIFLRELTRR